MKLYKKFALLCVLVLSVILTACSGAEDKTEDTALPDIKYPHFQNIHNSLIVADDEYKYLAVKDTIYRAPVGTDSFAPVYKNEDIVIRKIALAGDKIYFSSVSDLYSTDKEGNHQQYVFKLAEQLGTIYWQDFFTLGDAIYLKKGDSLVVRLESTDTGYATSAPQPVTYYNSRGMEYEFIRDGESGRGKLLNKADNIAIPSDGYIYNEDAFILTDDYIFYVSGNANDTSADMKIYRCNPDGSNGVCVAEFNSWVQPVTYDASYVYFKSPSHYYRMPLNSAHKFDYAEENDVEYYGSAYEVCDGRLYKVLTLNPAAICFDSGENIKITLE